MKTCPKCNSQIEDNAKFCNQCGAPLIEAVICSQCGASIPQDALFCPVCGNKIKNKSIEGRQIRVVVEKKSLLFGPDIQIVNENNVILAELKLNGDETTINIPEGISTLTARCGRNASRPIIIPSDFSGYILIKFNRFWGRWYGELHQ